MIRLNQLLKEETFTATNKQSGKTSVFKSKDSRDAAIKAGTHDAMKDKEQPSAPKAAGSSMFGGDYAKDRGGEAPKADTTSTPTADMGVDSVVYNKRTKTVGIVRMADERGETKTDADGNVNTDELEPYNPMKYPHQKDAQVAPSTTKEIDSRGLYKPFSQSANEPKKINNPTEALPKEIYAKMDNEDSDAGEMDYLSSTDGSIKYGIAKEGDKYYVTLGTEEGEILKSFGKTKDAGEAAQIFMKNLDAVKSKYNLDVDSNEPKAEPAKKRPGNPTVNKEAKKTAEKYGITPQKLGNEKYKEAMLQAAVSALTDSNFHSEARELVAAIEGKPEFAKKPEYPSMKDPKYKEKMADIRKNSADGSIYMNGTGEIDDYGTDVSQASGWDGVDAADSIAFTLRMNGFHKEADLIQSVFDNKPYMKNEGTIKLTKLMENDPCWKGYKQVGMKDKNGREVPNCVPEGVVNEQTSYAFGKQQYTQKTLTPSQILDLATAYVNVPNLEKIFNGKLDNIVNVANDLARLNGTIQLDAKTRGKKPALILSLLNNKLISKDDYVKLYRNLIEKQILTVKRLKNADPASRMIKGAAARQAYKDMKGEFDETN
jgi:hypothetical protein